MRVGGFFRHTSPGVVVAAGLLLGGCAAEQPAVAPAATPAADVPSAESLLGAAPARIEQWFGKPGLIRRDDPAQVWQYRDKSCVLDVYLYPAQTGMQVAHAEARSQTFAGDPMAPCLTSLADAKRQAVRS